MIRTAYRTSASGYGATSTRREIIMHDSVAFVALAASTLLLYGMTYFLFRSFQAHRHDLAVEWAQRGRDELQEGKPALAVGSLRAALSYAPDDYSSQLLLAQALAGNNETDQATNYFLNLWTARPGDGFLNLQLARLARRKGSAQDAIDKYRASIYGDWPQGDGIMQRRAVRLELVDYLIQRKLLPAARAELLIAAGNAPDTQQLDLMFGNKLLTATDPHDALSFFRKAIADDPRDHVALKDAGELEYAQGDFREAHELLTRAVEHWPDKEAPPELVAMARDAGRLVELSLSRELPARERARHLVEAGQIAQTRFNRCTGQSATLPSELADLQTRWKASADPAMRTALSSDAATQDTMMQLIFDTERETETTCGPATGDDLLLLRLSELAAGGTE